MATTAAIPRPGTPASTPLKAPATSSTTVEFAVASKPPLLARSQQPSQAGPRRSGRSAPLDYLSDKATTAFIRRTLCAQHLADRGRNTPAPIEELLPPLTSRNDIDLQLYALISVILKEFVQKWYCNITPDETFVAEIVQIIAHCTRALEERLRNVNLESLLLDELPELLDAHVRAYRTARDSAVRPPVEANYREIYHSLCPLPALSPVPKSEDARSMQAQADHETAYRQLLIQGVLALLLPTEDLENECLTSLVGQIVSELIVGNLVVNKLSEPWLLMEICIMLTRLAKGAPQSTSPVTPEQGNLSNSNPSKIQQTKGRKGLALHHHFWSLVQWGFLAVNSIRLFINLVVLSWSLRPRSTTLFVEKPNVTDQHSQGKPFKPLTSSISRHAPVRAPIAEFKVWTFVANLLEMDARMPWLVGAISMVQWTSTRGLGRIAGYDGVVDRLLSHQVQTYLLDPDRLPPLLRSTRGALFPNNAPGASSLVAPSSPQEMLALRRRCASALWAVVPKSVGRLYFGGGFLSCSQPSLSTTFEVERGTNDARSGPLNDSSKRSASSNYNTPHKHPTEIDDHTSGAEPAKGGTSNEDEDRILGEIESGILDVFSDAYCNKHLVYGMLELILVRLMPELAEKGVIELWEDRLS